jgi:hypothetical protein
MRIRCGVHHDLRSGKLKLLLEAARRCVRGRCVSAERIAPEADEIPADAVAAPDRSSSSSLRAT